MVKIGFFAYPNVQLISQSVLEAANELKKGSGVLITPWQSLDVEGLRLDNLIRDRIEQLDILFADITFPNFNVYYEIGFALGSLKPVVPTLNVAVENHSKNASLIGIFDTIGQLRYTNAHQLADRIRSTDYLSWTAEMLSGRNHGQPLFVLDTLHKIDFRNWIFQAIQNSKVQMRTYDPTEVPRLSAANALKLVSASTGLILPLLSRQIEDAEKHNLRVAFLAGLAHGLNLNPMIVQWERDPAPVDYTDFITTTNRRVELDNTISEYCQYTLIENQKQLRVPKPRSSSILSEIYLGASAAENEAEELPDYFVETAEYNRALRSQSSIIVGRKGSGKSAIFLMIKAAVEKDRRNLIIELNPASHNLSELREKLLGVMDQGVFDHSITAFWQYILSTEIVLAIRERLLPKAKYNLGYLNTITEIEKDIELTSEMAAGDFTSRLNLAITHLVKQIEEADRAISAEDITNMLFENEMRSVRDLIARNKAEFRELVLLFDNIDKGWPAHGVELSDIRIVRLMIEALQKLQRELSKEGVAFRYLVFLRTDVFDLLVHETPDRGKYNLIKIDWVDSEQLKNLLYLRLMSRFSPEEDSAKVWNAAIPYDAKVGDYFPLMISYSLMRPRFLIDLCERAISVAVNRGHEVVRPEDMREALRQHSNYLVSDFAYEIRDVSGVSEGIFYHFRGKGDLFTEPELLKILKDGESAIPPNKLLSLLLWYGFLGVAQSDTDKSYIFSTHYDMKRLESEITRAGSEVLYCVNPAFLDGLA